MLLGILSDTHGHVARTTQALAVLDRLGAQALIHCGDVGGAPVLDLLVGRSAWFVWGNTDDPDPALARYANSLGVSGPGAAPPLHVSLAGRTIAVFHGHESNFATVRAAETRGDGAWLRDSFDDVDYVLHGHTHEAHDRRLGPVRIINPGAIYRASPPTVATLDLASDQLRFWRIDLDANDNPQPHRLGT